MKNKNVELKMKHPVITEKRLKMLREQLMALDFMGTGEEIEYNKFLIRQEIDEVQRKFKKVYFDNEIEEKSEEDKPLSKEDQVKMLEEIFKNETPKVEIIPDVNSVLARKRGRPRKVKV